MAQNNRPSRLTFSFILSLCIHIAVIAFLAYGAWQTIHSLKVGQQGQAMEATMVDPQMMEHYLAQQSAQQKRLESVQKQQQAQELEYQKALQVAKEQEQQRLKALEKERKKVELEQQKLLEQQKKAQLEAKQLQAQIEADKKAAQALKQQQEKEKQAKLEAEKKAQALKQQQENERKAKLEAEKKTQAQKSQEVNSLLDDILSNNAASSDNKSTNAKMKGNVDTSEYILLMTQAIRDRFYNPNDIYSGKSCELKIRIDEAGRILSLSTVGGDAKLCAEAKKAAQSAKLPKPTAQEYPQVKNVTITFEPN